MLDSSLLQTAIKIYKSQAESLKIVIPVLFLIRLLFLYIKFSSVNEYFNAIRDLLFCTILLYNFESILNVLVQIPSHANDLHPISEKEVYVSQLSMFGTTMNMIVSWILAASYWLAVTIYVTLMFLLLIIGPYIFMFGTLIPSYGMIKIYFSVLVIISMWPMAWFGINTVTKGIIDSIEFLKDGVSNGIVLLLSGIAKALAPIVLLLAKNIVGQKLANFAGTLKSGFKPISKVGSTGAGVVRSAVKSDFVSNLRGKNVTYDSLGMPIQNSSNSGFSKEKMRSGLQFAGSMYRKSAGAAKFGTSKLGNSASRFSQYAKSKIQSKSDSYSHRRNNLSGNRNSNANHSDVYNPSVRSGNQKPIKTNHENTSFNGSQRTISSSSGKKSNSVICSLNRYKAGTSSKNNDLNSGTTRSNAASNNINQKVPSGSFKNTGSKTNTRSVRNNNATPRQNSQLARNYGYKDNNFQKSKNFVSKENNPSNSIKESNEAFSYV